MEESTKNNSVENDLREARREVERNVIVRNAIGGLIEDVEHRVEEQSWQLREFSNAVGDPNADHKSRSDASPTSFNQDTYSEAASARSVTIGRALSVTKRNEVPFTDLSIIEFKEELDPRFTCPVCKRPLNDPVQTECGHRLCYVCGLRTTLGVISIDQNPSNIDNLHTENSGSETEFDDWDDSNVDHVTNCEYREVSCPNPGCEEKIPKNKLDDHKNETCKYKPSGCQYCGQDVPEIHMVAHLQTCTKFPMTCEHCGISSIARDEMQHHLEKECAESEKPCKFYYAGCSFKAKDDAMNEHEQNQNTEHLNLMLEFSSKKEEKEINLSKEIEKVEQENASLQTQLSTHRETLAASTQDLRSYQGRLGKVEQTVGEHRREIAELRERLPAAASGASGKSNEFSYNFDEIRSTLAQQEVKLSELEADLSRGRLDSSLGPRSLASGSITLDRRLGRNEHQLALHDIQLAEHDLKIQMLEATSYDGTYIWKIDEFSRKHHEAIIGKTPSIYSPPFYVGRPGYKVCARVYPNGDGMGKGTHLSLLFVIMKGDYDALLPWPFRQKVTFKLLDHDRQNDIIDTLRPDHNSSSFKRPTSSMNIASGCPVFVSQQNLQKRSYIKDDVIFIKIIVDERRHNA